MQSIQTRQAVLSQSRLNNNMTFPYGKRLLGTTCIAVHASHMIEENVKWCYAVFMWLRQDNDHNAHVTIGNRLCTKSFNRNPSENTTKNWNYTVEFRPKILPLTGGGLAFYGHGIIWPTRSPHSTPWKHGCPFQSRSFAGN